jgi:hypothetical protein
MNLYPADATATSAARLFVFVTAVGSESTQLPLAFDTGSSGITLNALKIFPASMVSSSGFVFPAGQSTLTYNNITVTAQQGTRAYGGANGHTQVGNLGFASVTFGDSTRELVTQTMPVLFYFAIQSTATGEAVTPEAQDGWFGVNDAPNLISMQGATAAGVECSVASVGPCWVGSVLKYLTYSSAVEAGFVLSPITVQPCDITARNCTPAPALAIGLNSASAAGFSLTNLPCDLSYNGPQQINGYTVCQEYVPDTQLDVQGSSDVTFTGAVLFDTGTPSFVVNLPSSDIPPANVTSLQITTAGGFVYSASAGRGLFAIAARTAATTTQGSVMGLGYFQTNSLLTNFTTGIQGLK